MVKLCDKRKVVDYMLKNYKISVNRACKLCVMARSMWYYESQKEDKELIRKLNELAEEHPSRGLDEFVNRLRSMGYKWNRKRIYRVYKLLKLNKRRKIRKRLVRETPEPLAVPNAPNVCWSMDFMSDSLMNSRRIRVLNIIDDFNREALWVNAQYSYPSEFVVRALEDLEIEIGLPKKIRVDNGPEFISHKLQEYCKNKEITLEYIKPGRPTQNAYIERFNRHYREDILDAYLFESLDQVNKISKDWREDYNNNHPHKSLNRNSPVAFKELFRKGKIYSDSVKAEMNGS